jgi:hypothetical protein
MLLLGVPLEIAIITAHSKEYMWTIAAFRGIPHQYNESFEVHLSITREFPHLLAHLPEKELASGRTTCYYSFREKGPTWTSQKMRADRERNMNFVRGVTSPQATVFSLITSCFTLA